MNNEVYYFKGLFGVEKYINDIETSKDNIWSLKSLERYQVTVEMWDNYKPQKINLNDTFPWIRCKFELTMQMKGINFIVEVTEFKLFEDLDVNKESIIFILNHIELDNNLTNKYPN